MSKVICSTCQKPLALLNCGLCQAPVCKSCALLLEEDHFSFLATTPAELMKETYCRPCYEEQVAPIEASYQKTMEQAKEILVYMKSQSKETRLIKRKIRPYKVLDCEDEKELVMRLAFLAASLGCNAIIDVEISARKVKRNHYQTSKWDGVATPVRVATDRLDGDRVLLRNPN